MSIELLYTSAPKGLKQGSRGFCTVLSTARTPINIASRLESLSGYRQLYPPENPLASQNPIAYSHYRIVVAGKTLSVLSRITAYGSDYTGRTNKIAHHVVPDPAEQVAAGPAWVMMQPTVMRTSWSGQCETPERGPVIPSENLEPGLCNAWQSVAGDAGWGAVVADILMPSHRPPTWLIYRNDQQSLILPLINEAISLLPVDQRWTATFSTYATNVPPDVDCKLRCVLEGTEEARFASVKSNVIDMTKPMSLPTENELTQQARGIAPPPMQLPEPTHQTEATDDEAHQPKQLVTEIDLSQEPDFLPPQGWNPSHENRQSSDLQPPPLQPPTLPSAANPSKKHILLPVLAMLFLAIVGVSTWLIAERISGPKQSIPSAALPSRLDGNPGDADADTNAADAHLAGNQPASDDTNGASMSNTDDDAMSSEFNGQETVVASEPRPITMVLRYNPRQLRDAIEAVDAGTKPIFDHLNAIGSISAQLTKMPAAVGWRENPNPLLAAEQIEIPDTDLSISPRKAVVRRVDDLPSFSGAELLSFIDETSRELILSISIDPSRKQSVFADHVAAMNSMAQAIHDLRYQTDQIADKESFLPTTTRQRVTRFVKRIPVNESELIRGVMPIDNSPTLWQYATELHSEIELISGKGGPSTWDDTQRAALLAIKASLDEIAQSYESFRISLETLQKGQRLHVPDMFFYDADQKLTAALDIRLIVSW
ncbi:GAP1-N2 domain-containing protein [Stieleria varia]|uniref:Uncharacterized protein n=1 Tax=Stieleria varia TaxID=2528005 RepID=A0A5C6B4N8_9BACT|nr:hypothetical protein [Stieleria varia]TWU06441.1 hypothetical protein Pla52n_21620 [Stieleria varia]